MAAPLPEFPEPERRGPLTRGQVLDLFALLLVIVGTAGLVTAAWLVDHRLGLGVASVAVIALGVSLGSDGRR